MLAIISYRVVGKIAGSKPTLYRKQFREKQSGRKPVPTTVVLLKQTNAGGWLVPPPILTK